MAMAKAEGSAEEGTTDLEKIWLHVCDPEQGDVPLQPKPRDREPIPEKRTGWKTVRIFVSSTFRDFHYERDVLVKKVFPDLRRWCQKRRLHLVECDLRWGVPEHSPDEKTLRACLEEIDRCERENKDPYFINMTSERLGWVPQHGQVHQEISDTYRWVFGLSVTEMEIVHGAYRRENPNSLFLIRRIDDEFMNSLPESKYKDHFKEKSSDALKKLHTLKGKIGERFPEFRVIKYKCKYHRINPETKRIDLHFDGKPGAWEKAVLDFFKGRIERQYPLYKESEDKNDRQRELHEAFMKSRIDFVLGRDKTIKEIEAYLIKGESVPAPPMLLVGNPGSGKSSVMAKVADRICQQSSERVIQGMGAKGWNMFYHFVGAVPGSTDLISMLQRLLTQLDIKEGNSSDLAVLTSACYSALSNPNTEPLVVVVDAINQFDVTSESEKMTWLPHLLSKSVRVFVSSIVGSQHHRTLQERDTKPKEMRFPELTLTSRKNIIKHFMLRYNKELSVDQMVAMLEKEASNNPLWLNVACEELRVWGDLRKLDKKIEEIPPSLFELLEYVLQRFENELGDNAYLLRATLCLLECSSAGLFEGELLELLNDEILQNPYSSGKKTAKISKDPRSRLPAMIWHEVYRNIGLFLRPYGDSGEGRLDFFHRAISKVVRKRYLNAEVGLLSSNDSKQQEIILWWHKQLADYFENESLDRKLEEYCYHLIQIKDAKRLLNFLRDWDVFDKLYDEEFSGVLIRYWRECGEQKYDKMVKRYKEMLQDIKGKDASTQIRRRIQLGRLFSQAILSSEALEMAKSAETLSESSHVDRKMMIDLKSLFAMVYDQRMRNVTKVSRDQLPDCEKCLEYNDQCIVLLRQADDKNSKSALGKQLLKRASARATKVDVVGSVKGEEGKGREDVEEALQIFIELNDNGHLAEAYLEKAGLMNRNLEEALKVYEKGVKICSQAYGKYHILSSRLHKNTGICAEDIAGKLRRNPLSNNKDVKKHLEIAYKYYKEYYAINMRIFGSEHSKTKTAKSYLEEKDYVTIAKEIGENPFMID